MGGDKSDASIDTDFSCDSFRDSEKAMKAIDRRIAEIRTRLAYIDEKLRSDRP